MRCWYNDMHCNGQHRSKQGLATTCTQQQIAQYEEQPQHEVTVGTTADLSQGVFSLHLTTSTEILLCMLQDVGSIPIYRNSCWSVHLTRPSHSSCPKMSEGLIRSKVHNSSRFISYTNNDEIGVSVNCLPAVRSRLWCDLC